MLKKGLRLFIAGTALSTTMPLIAVAQDTAPQNGSAPSQPAGTASAANEQPGGLGDIVVTARVKSENLQNVPVSIQVVTGQQLQNLAITNVSDVSHLTPGLTLKNDGAFQAQIVLRGVRWTNAGGAPAIPTYLNEVSFDPNLVLQSLYDVSQIETLRGPQGITRGAPSISGAVTITSHRPDLNNIGGYGYGILGTRDHRDVQGAINVPIIPGMLALRVAGMYETSNGNGVRSLNSTEKSRDKSWSGRASLRFEPTDNFSVNAMYQHQKVTSRRFDQVAGSGSPGFTVNPALPPVFGGGAPLILPPNFNSPAIDARDYLSVENIRPFESLKSDLITVNAVWDILGQKLTYNFGYSRNASLGGNSNNIANMIVGFDSYAIQDSRAHPTYIASHEIRLASNRGDHIFDYEVGYTRARGKAAVTYDTVGAYLPGAFGAPLISPSNPFTDPAVISRYVLPIHLDLDGRSKTSSVFGNISLHLPWGVELSGGVRRSNTKSPFHNVVHSLAGTVSLPAFLPPAFGGCPVPGLPASAVYGPAFCDVSVPAGLVSDESFTNSFKSTIFNVSLSKRFSNDVLAYVTVGTSFRPGVSNTFNTGLQADLLVTGPEKATSYEVGIKSMLLDRRVRFNADVFQIDYNGQLTQYSNIPYFNTVSGQTAQTGAAFYQNADARVRGVEAELEVEPIDNLTLTGNVSYTKIESKSGSAPCNDPSRPLSATNTINFCPVVAGKTLNPTSPFQANIIGEYRIPLNTLSAYARFIADHRGHNPNYGVSAVPAKSYTLVDLFAGITGPDGAWDIGAYVKNAFNVKRTLTQVGILPPVADFGPTGLNLVSTTHRREFGLTARYTFGSK